mmetsp:Transcript_37984/g.80029  ORF Transcript_37984/g.80029 Transcript_37984/m.80029 type:complete len:520 (-) Transcript_37984:396-1955(-)
MFAIIGNVLISHAPSWYRTPKMQTACLGIVFFWVFAAYTTIQFYSASIYGSELAADSVSAVYLTFTLTCLISPGIINKWGCRLAMFVGVLGYASLVLASLVYFLYGRGEGNVLWARRLVVMGGAVLGCGASTLWTAQGRLILQYASRVEELENVAAATPAHDPEPAKQCQRGEKRKSTKSHAGKLVGLFWAIFQCSSLVGGSISFLYYNRKPEGSAALYSLFLTFIIMGALFTQLLLPPSMLRNNNNTILHNTTVRSDVEMTNESTPLNDKSNWSAGNVRGDSNLTDNEDITMDEDLSRESWRQEARGTLKMVFTKRMLCLSLLFFYTGFNQPYQQATFGNRFFTRRTIGAELIIFHLMEIIGAIVCGRFLDEEDDTIALDTQRRRRALVCLGAFVFINGAGNILAAMQEFAAERETSPIVLAHDIADPSVITPSLSFAFWGFADAQIQVYCYWLIGSFYSSGGDHSRAVGWYKCVQSLGTSIGFYFIPTSRLSEMSQLALSSAVFIVGTALSFSQLPS